MSLKHYQPLHVRFTQVGLTGLGAAVFLLVFHIPLSDWSGLPITAAVSALVPALLAIIALPGSQRKAAILRVDSHSILFFAGLFMLIGGLEKVHLFEILADAIAAASNPTALVMALHWGPGLLSGVLDNVPLALAMSYVLEDLAAMPGMPALGLMVWSLALGVDIGGNLTPIGASANVVAYSYMEHNHGSIGWKRWITIALPPTIIVMLLASLLIFLKGHIGWY